MRHSDTRGQPPPRPNFRPVPNPRYRTISESEVIDLLLLVSWACDIESTGLEQARTIIRRSLHSWIAKGLGYRLSPAQDYLFDPVEVINHMKWLGLSGEDDYWEAHFVANHRGFVAEFSSPTAAFKAPLPDRPFHVTLSRTFDLQAFPEGTSLRLRAPRPIPSHYHQQLVTTAGVYPADAGTAQLREHSVELRTAVSSERWVTLSTESTILAQDPTARRIPLSETERTLYLRRDEGFIKVTPRVEALAHELSAWATTPEQAVSTFWAYLMQALCSGMVRYEEFTAETATDWVLTHGWYDCQLGAALLVSLCRALGIPARLVNGHLLYRLQPINHYWCEIWLDSRGWQAFDVICWDLSRAGADRPWMDLFAGQIDYRLATQIFPLAFTGPMNIHFPPAWQMMQSMAPQGAAVRYTNLATGQLLFRDQAEVRSLEDENQALQSSAPSSTLASA